jgi:hypothetical protein
MAITINNGVANINGTPGAISGTFANRPAAPDQAEGTLYFSTDTAEIYQVVAGAWILYLGGGGGGGITTANNGLSVSGGTTAQLGGTLIKPTTIDANNKDFYFLNGSKFNIDCLSLQFTSNTDNPFLKSDGALTWIGLENSSGSANIYMEYGFNGIIKSVYNNNDIGLRLDFPNDDYFFGVIQYGVGLNVYSTNYITLGTNLGNGAKGVTMNLNSNEFSFGSDFNFGDARGVYCDLNNDIYIFGTNGTPNVCRLSLYPLSNSIELSCGNLINLVAGGTTLNIVDSNYINTIYYLLY